ncbi:hypothetical protein Q8A73_024459 [Channa argus]|nr:hypothetical protein Q8A73_024459 [Channa argus]
MSLGRAVHPSPGAFTQAVEHEPGQGRINPGPGYFFTQGGEHEPGQGSVGQGPGAFTQAVEREPGQGSIDPGPGAFNSGCGALWSMSLGRGELTQALDVFTQAREHKAGQGVLNQALDVFTQAVEHEPGQGSVKPGPGCFYPGCGA